MSLKTLGGRTFAALTFGALTLHGVSTGPIPPTPPPVVWTMQGGPGGQGGGKRWVEEAHAVDQARIAARALAESADEEAVLLVILQAAVEQYYT